MTREHASDDPRPVADGPLYAADGLLQAAGDLMQAAEDGRAQVLQGGVSSRAAGKRTSRLGYLRTNLAM
jgi:hypothetical protein